VIVLKKHLEIISEGIYAWYFHNWIAIRSENTHEVTRCNYCQRG